MIFDLDGTLIDHVGSVTRALERWLPELGVSLTDALRAAWFEADDEHFRAWRSLEMNVRGAAPTSPARLPATR